MRTCLASGFVWWPARRECATRGSTMGREESRGGQTWTRCRMFVVAKWMWHWLWLWLWGQTATLTLWLGCDARPHGRISLCRPPATAAATATADTARCPVGIATCLWPARPGMAGRFAALREIGYQSFCNLVCNLKFMKHIPLTQKMQANVWAALLSSLAPHPSTLPPFPLPFTHTMHTAGSNCRLHYLFGSIDEPRPVDVLPHAVHCPPLCVCVCGCHSLVVAVAEYLSLSNR